MKNGQTSVFHRCVYTIHIYFLSSLRLCVCVCYFSGIIILFNVCWMPHTHMSRSSKLKSWLWWCLMLLLRCLRRRHRSADARCWLKTMTKTPEKKQFKNYITLHITNRRRFVQIVTIIAAWPPHCSHPNLVAQLHTYAMTPTNDKFQRTKRKITIHSSLVCVCKRAYACVCTEWSFWISRKNEPSQLFTGTSFSSVLVYGHKIQSANMKCRWWLGQFG